MLNKNKNYFINFVYLSIFAISLAFLEAAVVIYLRQIYYPQGFQFSLEVTLTNRMFYIEILRELSTLIIIIFAALLSGQKFMDRFAYFIYIFAIWDIFYYIFLKLTTDWPSSFLTWDVLFFIPVPWTAPVLFPIISSVTMIVISIFLYNLYQKYSLSNLSKLEWSLLSTSAFIIFISFIWGYLQVIFENFDLIIKGTSPSSISSGYIPARFFWEIFIMGELLSIAALLFIFRRVRSKDKKKI